MKRMKRSLKCSMIALIMITLTILFVTELNAQDVVQLDTPFDREITLEIPEDYDDLRDLTIRIAELYWGERYDLEQALENTDKLQEALKDVIDNAVGELKEQNDELLSLLEEKVRPEILRPMVDASIGVTTEATVSGSIGFGLLLFDKFTVRAYASYPIVIGISIGFVQ